jgi:hypothetical protein
MAQSKFAKKLTEEKPDRSDFISLRMDDISSQQALLAKGWRGIAMEHRDGEYWVRFGKKA